MTPFWWVFVGFIIGALVDMIVGTSVISWHFRHRFWMVNPDRRDEYPISFRRQR